MKQIIISALIFFNFIYSQQQIEGTLVLNRGKLWHSFNFSQEVEPMNDWRRLNYGLDWPGYNEKELDVAIGGYNSYLVSGGFFITAKTDSGTTWGWDNFATNGLSAVGISGDNNRYLVKRHEKKKNHWLLNNPSEAEETIYTEFEFNGAWFQPWDNQNIPVNVKRVVRQWSGSKADQDYVIIEYTFTNVLRRDPLEGVYLLFTYALSPNHRGWNLTYPNLTSGARNVESQWNAEEKLLTYYAGDFKDSPGTDDSYDYHVRQRYNAFSDKFDDIPEWVAPGHAGIKFLYISADTFGVENRFYLVSCFNIWRFFWTFSGNCRD